ncbi:O-antigen ligase family protein [Candidatus Pelagibacter sp. HIMB1517]|uniref:O-antigen ligase family protein n=1 Tax=Candidatus Pelagibacter sp. HIMB1517 TaxID=3413341 RepID=UPI003F846CA1
MEFIFDLKFLSQDQAGANMSKISGLFGDEYVMGSYIARLTPVTIALFFFLRTKQLVSSNHQYLFFLFYISVFISGERTSFVMINLTLFLYIIFVGINFKDIFKMFLIIFFLILTLVIYKPEIFHRMVTFTLVNIFPNLEKEYRDITNYKGAQNLKSFKKLDLNFIKKIDFSDAKIFSSEHQKHYKIAINIFKDNLFFGSGPKMFRYKCAEDKYYLGYRSCTTHPHNIFLTFLSELGIFGFIFILLFFFYLIFKLILNLKIFKKNKLLNHEALLIISTLVSIFPLLPAGNFFNNWLSYLFYINIGIYFGLLKDKKC